MVYQPDPQKWPPRVAAYMTRIRSLLQNPGALLITDELIRQLVAEEGLQGGMADLWSRGGDEARRAAEIEFLVFEALRQLDRRGEIVPGEAPFHGTAVSSFIGMMGWEGANQYAPSVRHAYRPSVQMIRRAQQPWVTLNTRWANVDRLAEQALEAWTGNLDVAAAVTARVAVEEAVRRALEDVGAADWEDKRAARREAILFDSHLKSPEGFEPLDREATRAALSATRSLGNGAAHDGVVDDAILEESLMRLLPRALMSLSAATSP